MSPFAASADHKPAPPEARPFDVAVLTVVLWATYFVTMTIRAEALERYGDFGSVSARAATAVAGAMLCLGVSWLLSRRGRMGPLPRFFWATALAVPACAVLTIGSLILSEQVSSYFISTGQVAFSPRTILPRAVILFWVFFAWSAAYAVVMDAADRRFHDIRLARAEAAAQKAQLMVLRLQVHPHFLFNTLNAVASLIASRRAEEAEAVVMKLSGFLRHALEATPGQTATLRDEITNQRLYLDIETVRFSDRLKVRFDIADDCGDALVPSFILLPLTENAIKHGLARVEGAVTIAMAARRDGDNLVLSVEDDAPPYGPSIGPVGLGLGLGNVADHLKVLFGDMGRLTAGPTPRGWRCEIRLPFTSAA